MNNINRASPGCLLSVVDLPKIQERLLNASTSTYTPILYDPVVSVILAVFATVALSEKHTPILVKLQTFRKGVGLHHKPF
jgi:hypothetical protein